MVSFPFCFFGGLFFFLLQAEILSKENTSISLAAGSGPSVAVMLSLLLLPAPAGGCEGSTVMLLLREQQVPLVPSAASSGQQAWGHRDGDRVLCSPRVAE